MGRPLDTLSSKRGRNKLKSHTDKIVSRTLKLLDSVYKDAQRDDATPTQRKDALMMYIDIWPFIRPKLSAIAPAELDRDGDVVSPGLHAALVRELQLIDDDKKARMVEACTTSAIQELAEA